MEKIVDMLKLKLKNKLKSHKSNSKREEKSKRDINNNKSGVSKLNLLRADLKRLIFKYIKPYQVIRSLLKVSKSFKEALLKSRLFQMLKLYFKDIYPECDLNKDKWLDVLIKSLLEKKYELDSIKELCVFMLLYKYKAKYEDARILAFFQSEHENLRLEILKEVITYLDCISMSIIIKEESLSPDNFKSICQSLSKNKNIEKLELYHHEAFFSNSPHSLFSVADFFISLPAFGLKELNLCSNGIGKYPKSVIALSNAIAENKTLKILSLALNELGENEESLKYLSEAIAKNKGLKKLILYENLLGENTNNIFLISQALMKNKSLRKLYLGKNAIGKYSENCKYLAEAIESNRYLQYLSIDDNNLGQNPENIKLLSEAFIKNTSLVELQLNKNVIGSSGESVQYIANMISKSKSLQKLALKNNQLGLTQGNMKILCSAIAENSFLKSLDLACNDLGKYQEDIESLTDAIARNRGLEELDISINIYLKKEDLISFKKANKKIKIKIHL